MLKRAVVAAAVLLAFNAGAANVDPELDAVLDGMEMLCGERYAGPLDSRDRGHLYCIRAYSATCALKNGDSPREQQVLAHSCARNAECPHCPGAQKSAASCVIEFKRYRPTSAFAETTRNCERHLVDGMTRGGPEMDVFTALIRDPRNALLPACESARDREKYRSYCMCMDRPGPPTRTRSTERGAAPASREEWQRRYQTALAEAEAAGCDLVLTR